MEELKMKLQMERIDLLAEVEKYNKKAELLGLEKIELATEKVDRTENKTTNKKVDALEKYRSVLSQTYLHSYTAADVLESLGFTKIDTNVYTKSDEFLVANIECASLTEYKITM